MVEHLAYNEKVIGSNPMFPKLQEKIAQWFRVLACRAKSRGFKSRFSRILRDILFFSLIYILYI